MYSAIINIQKEVCRLLILHECLSLIELTTFLNKMCPYEVVRYGHPTRYTTSWVVRHKQTLKVIYP